MFFLFDKMRLGFTFKHNKKTIYFRIVNARRHENEWEISN